MRISRIARHLSDAARRLLHPSAPAFRKSVYGPLLLDTPGDRTFELCLTGYGPFVAERIAGYGRDFLFLDIGANLGLFSLIADRQPLCRRALAFEPLPSVFASLRANLERNSAAKVTAHCCAISDAGGHVELSYNPAHSGMSKVMPLRGPGTVRASAIGATELDRLVGDPQGDILAKIDVEGSELAVLSILRQTGFYPAIKAIIIEVSEHNLAGEDQAGLLALLASEGFVEMSRSGTEDHYDAYYARQDAADQKAAAPTLSG